MRKSAFIFSLLCIIYVSACSVHQHTANSKLQPSKTIAAIDSLLDRASYFKARELFELNKEHIDLFSQIRYNANLYSVFNRPNLSNQNIQALFENYENELTPSAKKDLLLIQIANSVKLYEYEKASQISNLLTTNYTELISDSELFEIRNNNIVWQALKSYPKQEVDFKDSSTLPITRNSIGLKTIEVKQGNSTHPFIFDTGANISTVTESQAEAMHLDIIDVKVKVSAITGKLVDAKVGVSSELMIGNMVFNNIAFLVFPDEALYFPQVNFQITGILGFPVIEAMKEIHFIKNDELYVPVYRNNNYESNLAIAYLTPIINLKSSLGEMYFSFDTGADETVLYLSYYERNNAKIDSLYTKTKISFSGVGGRTQVDGYRIDFDPIINGKTIHLSSVGLLIDEGEANNTSYYGNIGQDLISNFDKMILNFEKMYIHFE